jgi:predicted amidohydrolase YtcJ
MSLGDAVNRATREAAHAARWESVTGRLAPGLSADLVVLDADPFTEGLATLLTARPRLTVVAGSVAHELWGQRR